MFLPSLARRGGYNQGVQAVSLSAPFDFAAVPDRAAVFVIHNRHGEPYLGRTALLRRRLRRLLGPREGSSRLPDLRSHAETVDYYLTGSRLASSLQFYELARRYFPDSYAERLRLRPPVVVKVLLNNEFPRTTVSTRLSGSAVLQYGPFRSRVSAERFEEGLLDLFQVRRCQPDLEPSEQHPGCIYGEMMKCLRPCQQVVGKEEYGSEVRRLAEFLASAGRSLLDPLAAARERASAELDFEQAARQHQRFQRIEQVLRLRDELAAALDRVCGVAVGPSPQPGAVELHFMIHGIWLNPLEFRVAAQASEMVPLDRRLREAVATLELPRLTLQQRSEHLSLLSRWFYSSYRDGEWLSFGSLDELPYRRLVRAISKTAAAVQAELFEN